MSAGKRWIVALGCGLLSCSVDDRSVEVASAPNAPGQMVDGTASSAPPLQPSDGAAGAGTSATPSSDAPSSDVPVSSLGSSGAAVNRGFVEPGTLTAAVEALDFERREVGTTSASSDWNVTYSGTLPSGALQIDNSNPGEFAATSTCPETLGPNESCAIHVTFTPGVGGLRSGRVELRHGADVVGLDLTGIGLYRVTIEPSGTGTGNVRSTPPAIDCGATCSGLFAPGPVYLAASTTNGSNSFFSGWSGSSCNGPTRDCSLQVDGTKSLVARFSAQDHNLIFASSKPYPSDLGGLAAYDAECNAVASAAGINDAAGTAFVAGMTDSAGFADPAGKMAARLGAARAWVRMDGLPFGDQQADLFATPPNVYHSVAYTENGDPGPLQVWASFETAGTEFAGCNDWTDTSAQGIIVFGSPYAGPQWRGAYWDTCAQTDAHLYCMSKTKTRPLEALPRLAGKRIWVTNTAYLPGSMTPDAKCQSERPAGVTQAVAFITYLDRPASSVIDPQANYVRPDGLLVGTGAQVIAMELVSGPWLLANGSTSSTHQIIWTGGDFSTTEVGTVDGTCNNWRSESGLGNGGNYGFTNMGAWSGYLRRGCNEGQPLYCVEP